MQRVLDAIEAFWYYLSDVRALPLAAAMGCQLLKVACTSRAWRNVIAAAYPQERVRWLPIYGSMVAGAGVNALFPARAGDLVRLFLARRSVAGSTYTTLVSSMLVLTIVDLSIALGLFIWALTEGVLPSLDVLHSLPSFDFRWFLEHGQISEFILAFLVVGLIAFAVWARPRWRELEARFAQAFAILRSPARYFRSVVLWQLCDWALRLSTIWLFLAAFGIHQSVRNVLLVQATTSLATVIPISPGGIGTEQAFLLYVLRGEAPRTALLAFSVGMKITLTAVNVAVGFAAILLTLGTLRFRRATTSPADGS